MIDWLIPSWHLLVIFQVIFHHLPGCLPLLVKYWATDLMIYWPSWVTTPDFTRLPWLFLVIFRIFQVIFHCLSCCLPSLVKYWATELLTNWLSSVNTPDFMWPPSPVYSCSSSIVFQAIFHHLPCCLLLPGKYRIYKLLIKLDDCSYTRISLRWHSNFEVVFYIVFHHLPSLPPSWHLPSTSAWQLPSISIFIRSPVYSHALFFFCLLNIMFDTEPFNE